MIKQGVKVAGLRPEILLAIVVADKVWSKHGQDLIITSLNDSKHGFGSLHFANLAIDFRTRYFTSQEKTIAHRELSDALGDEYDVVLESDHMHVEFQPKR